MAREDVKVQRVAVADDTNTRSDVKQKARCVCDSPLPPTDRSPDHMRGRKGEWQLWRSGFRQRDVNGRWWWWWWLLRRVGCGRSGSASLRAKPRAPGQQAGPCGGRQLEKRS